MKSSITTIATRMVIAENILTSMPSQEAIGHLDNRRSYSVEAIRWTGKSSFLDSVRQGDLIVQVSEERKARSRSIRTVGL